jgi:predicted PurR-regulated permease PerM
VPRSSANTQWQHSIVVLAGTVIAAAVVSTLYWAQIVFVPVALAVLATFLLTPPVRWLERKGLGRAPAVGLVVIVAMGCVAETGWLITRQMSSLAQELPNYTVNIQKKVQSMREMSGGWDRLQKMIDDVTGGGQAPADLGLDVDVPKEPTTVTIRPDSVWVGRWPHFIGSAAEVAGGMALTFVLAIFGLFKREDLRNRFLRLIGHGRLAYTTKAVDEAGDRVSRYLFTQAIVNLGYGLTLAIGLSILGVQYALLWGFLAAMLRYVPYIGAWLSITFPLAISIATAETWFQPLAALGLFIAMELVTYNAIEPIFFKRSMGVSEVAQLVSAAFWGFLWGPVGLVLSAPLTVCLLVVGKYVPQLEFLDVLLGDDPPLEPAVSLYQRLLAWDEDDATRLVNDQLKVLPPDAVYDELLIPALSFVKRDRIREEIAVEDEEYILRATREVIDDLAPLPPAGSPPATRLGVLACPAFDGADHLALEMLGKLLGAERWKFDIVPSEMLAAEIVDRAVAGGHAIICIGSVPPGGLAHTRYLCKRLRSQLPNVKILVGRWGRKANEESGQQLNEAGADVVTTTLLATRSQFNTWQPILTQSDARSAAAATKPTVDEVRSKLAAV